MEIYERYLAGWGFKEITNHLNRPGGPPPPQHVDSKRNTAGKWSKSTVRCILENPVYTGRLYWNRLDFRQSKLGEGPLVRRPEDEWVQAERRHPAIITDEQFQKVQAHHTKRISTEGTRRRSSQRRSYALRGIVHCATGHNPLRMHGKERKGITYYACCYRIAYGDAAAQALGHGKWQYMREDNLEPIIDKFFATDIFGAQSVRRFREQHAALIPALMDQDATQRKRLTATVADLDQRIERQVAAIESGVDPVLVGERIRSLKGERQQSETALAQLDLLQREQIGLDLDEACAVLDSLPDLSKPLAKADPELRRSVYEAFQFGIELDRNKPEIRLKALISSAFSTASDLDDLAGMVANGVIAGARDSPVRAICGAEVTVGEGEAMRHLTLLVRDHHGWRHLCRLLTIAHRHTRDNTDRRAGQPSVGLEDVLEHAEGLVCLTGCAEHGVQDEPTARRLLDAFGPSSLRVELR